ncbi:MAG: LptF/LptG family permease, partial [Sphaerochaetaceae bacterium]|nr:LptF/LptG family permease [Sphaerochaetaceae bacterium]
MEFGLRGSHRIVYTYVIREFLLSLLVAFIFFFFIFFINQLLLLAQKILLKNVRLSSVLKLVIFAIPQILLYTLPFSSLSASSMVIGEFTSHNEILALRACGIPLRHLYLPIMVCALILSGITFCVADIMLPVSSQSYRTIYSELLQDLPTMELDSYSVNKVGNTILVTGQVDGDTVYDLVMLDTAGQSGGTVISAARAKVVLIDID